MFMKEAKKIPKYTGTDIVLTNKQKKQLKQLVNYVRKNSKIMAKLYQGIGDDFTLRDLPVTTKEMIMKDYDNWITTSDFTLKELEAFAADEGLAGELYQGKYTVVETSGSTGYPFYMAYNRRESGKMYSAMSNHLKMKFVLHKPACYLFPFDKHILSICSAKESLRKYPLMKKYTALKDSNIPVDEMVEFLNKFQPKIICTYVSTIEALAKEQMKGTLRLKLKEVITGGETLSQKTREHIEKVFKCKMRSIYASTEASGIALDCDYGHMHLHNDSLIIEPVDENNNPVSVGEKSHKILITSLYERTVPLIRYGVSDKVTIHNTTCKCGNKSPWIEVEGRSVEPPFIFKNADGEVSVSTFVLFVKTMGLPNVRKIQLILHGYEQLECRVDFIENVDEQKSFEVMKKILTDSLDKYNVKNVNIYLSKEKPQTDAVTHKFKFAYQVMER